MAMMPPVYVLFALLAPGVIAGVLKDSNPQSGEVLLNKQFLVRNLDTAEESIRHMARALNFDESKLRKHYMIGLWDSLRDLLAKMERAKSGTPSKSEEAATSAPRGETSGRRYYEYRVVKETDGGSSDDGGNAEEKESKSNSEDEEFEDNTKTLMRDDLDSSAEETSNKGEDEQEADASAEEKQDESAESATTPKALVRKKRMDECECLIANAKAVVPSGGNGMGERLSNQYLEAARVAQKKGEILRAQAEEKRKAEEAKARKEFQEQAKQKIWDRRNEIINAFYGKF